MLPAVHSLLRQAGNRADEIISTLAAGRAFRLEHIASHATTSPPGVWYDQDRPEWVTLVHGTASLEFADGSLHLQSGDCLLIPAHLKHRVSATSPDAVWIALHFEASSDGR